MKLFIVVDTYSDDDGNVGSLIKATCKTKEEAIKEVKKYHDEIAQYYSEPDDTYDDGDPCFDISEEEDITIRNIVEIKEIEIN